MTKRIETLHLQAKTEYAEEYNFFRRFDRDDTRFTTYEKFAELLLKDLAEKNPECKEAVEQYLKDNL
jgi:hypothetical protein